MANDTFLNGILSNIAKECDNEKHAPFLWESSEPGNSAALLIHGFPGTPYEMRGIATHLHEQFDWTVQGLLLPGFGREFEQFADYAVDDRLTYVKNAYQQLKQNHQHVVLVGYSLGGAIATIVAADVQPDALILFAPFWKFEAFLWTLVPVLTRIFPRFHPFRIFSSDLDDPEIHAVIEEYFPGKHVNDPEVQQAIKSFEIPSHLLRQLKQTGDRGYQAAVKVTCPVLVIQGTGDNLVKPAFSRTFTKRFTQGYYHEIAGTHELIEPDSPSLPEICDTITDFIETGQFEETT